MVERKITNEELDLMLQFHQAKIFFLHSALKAVILPVGYLICAFWLRGSADDTFSDVFSPAVVDIGAYVLLGGAFLGVVLFAPRMIRDARDLLLLNAKLKAHKIRPTWLERPDVSGYTKRYVGHSAVAFCISLIGAFIDGWLGTLLKIVGSAGVLYLGLMLIFTGDVVWGGIKDQDEQP